MTMRERIKKGLLFNDLTEGLKEERYEARVKMYEFNMSRVDELEKRQRLLNEIFGKETDVYIEPPFYFAYGTNINICC